MKSKEQLFLFVACLIVTFDVLASFASRLLHFNYDSLIWVSCCLFALCGYVGFRYGRLLGGFLVGLIAGLADSTLGWVLSTLIHPYMSSPDTKLTVFNVSVGVVFVTLVGGFFGFIGALVANGISLLNPKRAA
jgi:hypothetical protein